MMNSNVRRAVRFVFVLASVQHVLSVCVNTSHYIMTNTTNTFIDPNSFVNTLETSGSYGCLGAKFVNVSHNKISMLNNETFDKMWNIEVLDCSYNNIANLTADVFKYLRTITHLYISNNQLTTLPLEFFYNKDNLIVVDLSYNYISHIPLIVFNYSLNNIKEVLLHHNLLTTFEPWAVFRQGISNLDLRFNNISSFSNHYNYTYSGRSIYDTASTDLRNNSIRLWHDWYLMQYNNPSRHVGVEVITIEIPTDIRENPLVCDCNVHNLVTSLRRSFYKWTKTDSLTIRCYDPPKLRDKRIMYDINPLEFVCNVSNDCPQGCLCQDIPEQRIMKITCTGLGLKEVPPIVPLGNYGNIHMHLDDNEITRLDNVSYVNTVTLLTIANNSLSFIADVVMNAIASKENATVNFYNNKLSTIPEGAQNVKYQNTNFMGNSLVCSCDMLWMVDWISLAPAYVDKGLKCSFEGTTYDIVKLDDSLLKCHNRGNVVLIVVVAIALVIVLAVIITAKRCPYETKVLIYKIFRIHLSDKYKVNKTEDIEFDMYTSFDEEDPYVRQWLKKVLYKKLEDKASYKLCLSTRNGKAGSESEIRLELIEKSKLLLIIFSDGYDRNPWCQYEAAYAETLACNDRRVLYLIYDKSAEEQAKSDPWLSKMKTRKVFRVKDRMLWAKFKYELARKPNS